jgi:hypothetical protein
MGFIDLCPVVAKVRFRTPDIPGFAESCKEIISLNANESFGISAVRGNIYRNRTAIN